VPKRSCTSGSPAPLRLAAFFSQMGGLRGLLPFLEGEPDLDVRWYGREPALGYLRSRGYPAEHLGALRMEAGDGRILLTDTINLSRTGEGVLCREAWRKAAAAGTPSVAFVDSWWGYRERFTLPGEDLDEALLPDAIVVVDEIAHADMAGLGFPRERLHVLGSPWLASLAREASGAAAARAQARAGYGIAGDDLVLGFISQPLERVLGDRDSWGFTERDVVPALLHACDSLPAPARKRLRVLALAHPEEDAEHLAGLVAAAAPSFPVEVRKEADTLALVRACDAVAGMFSILLLEAALCGLPVLSIQPNLRREDMLVINRTGATVPVREVGLLPAAVARLLCDETYRGEQLARQRSFPVVAEATELWRGLLHDITSRGTRP